MEMDREIEVRNLEGESIALPIHSNLAIADVKKILRESFLPAKKSPNFHLYFKGSKLRLDSQVDRLGIKNGEFVVFVPFAKKSQQTSSLQDQSEESTTPSVSSQQNLMSPAADLAWRDLLDDLSSLSDISSKNAEASIGYRDMVIEKLSLNVKRKREAVSNHPLQNVLCSDSKDVFEQETRDIICQTVESVNCLMNSSTENCLLFEEFSKRPGKLKQCACPLWLKKILKTFSFLNIFYALFHARHEGMSWDVIKEALKQPNSFGLENVCISDIENLCVLCPKVVVALNKQQSEVAKPGLAIIIGDTSAESADQCESAKKRRIVRMRPSTIINAIEKRALAFRTDLWRLIKSSMEKKRPNTSMPVMLLLEDLLTLVKDGIVLPEHCEVQSGKPRSLASGCHGTNRLGPTEIIDHLRKGLGLGGQIVHVEDIAARQAVYNELPNDLLDSCTMAIKGIGISRLYNHQAEAIRASLSGKNVVVSTSTSSGKSLCYNLPVLETLLKDPLACALYLFPTKALAQDQLRAFLDMTAGLDTSLSAGVYDGDTSQEDRTWIRDNARLLITNPDMLHVSFLPYHAKFERILSNLRIIVIDEAHVYKGAFGCHTALILRRLRRICSHVYGTTPSFIFSTATSANPREHAMELANLQTLELIQNDGSPCGEKYFLLWNPPLRSINGPNLSGRNEHGSMNSQLCTRRSSAYVLLLQMTVCFIMGYMFKFLGPVPLIFCPILEASYLFAEMVQHGLRCITFCKTRKLSELVLSYTREILQETAPCLVDSICVYRGGYTPQDRRKIEADFFGGKLRGVAATNALELGIDVGHIDATLHLGFPGSIASLWQQAGRSGRRSRPSLAIYVAFEGPLDQHFMKFPHKLFKKPVEHCQVDGQNQKVLEQHIACAAFELPLSLQYDKEYFGSGLDNAITVLESKGCLSAKSLQASSTKMWSYIGPEDRPSIAVSIRAIETEKYRVIDLSTNKVLEEIEESRAFFQVYEGAVYMNQGFTYLVKTLDLSEKVAFCQKADLKYYTKTRDYTDIHVLGGDLAYPPIKASEVEYARTTAKVNCCKVTTNWFGFYRIWKTSNKIYDTVALSLPEFTYESQAAWIHVPQSIKIALEKQEGSFRAGLHAASHALLNVVPLYIMCNASDLSAECANPHETRAFPERLLLYDRHPGGIGITSQIQLLFRELLTAALELVSTCNCLSNAGCPNCIQALLCSEYNEVLDKSAAITILEGVIEAENSYFQSRKESSESPSTK